MCEVGRVSKESLSHSSQELPSHELDPGKQGSIFQYRAVNRSNCSRRQCQCPCHRRKRGSFQTPKNFLGSVFIGYSIVPYLSSACVNGCESSSVASISFVFPQWFSCRMIMVQACDSSLFGPELLIREYRIRPDDDPIFNTFDIDTMRYKSTNGEWSPRDVSSQGENMLLVSVVAHSELLLGNDLRA